MNFRRLLLEKKSNLELKRGPRLSPLQRHAQGRQQPGGVCYTSEPQTLKSPAGHARRNRLRRQQALVGKAHV